MAPAPDLSFQPFNFCGVYDDHDDDDAMEDNDHQRVGVAAKGKHMETNSPMVDFQVYSPLFLDFGICHPNPSDKTSSHVVPSKINDPLIHEDNSRKPSKTSLELLTNYWTNMVKKSKPGKPERRPEVPNPRRGPDELKALPGKLSTQEIIRVAGVRYVQFPEQSENHLSIITHPFGPALSGLSEEETKEIELVQFLLAATEKVGDGQFDRASRLLSYCELLASKRASPAQRVVLYFAEALSERIDMEKGKVDLKVGGAKWTMSDDHDPFKINRHGLGSSLTLLKCHRQTPFTQVTQFAGVQSIIEHTSASRRIHVIDLEIRSGVQWVILMEALVERVAKMFVEDENSPNTLELLRITAIMANPQSHRELEETGERLASTAKSMNIPFSFSVVASPNMEGIQGDMFGIEHGETVIVYAPAVLRTMIVRPDKLEGLMRALRSRDPALMLVSEVEANHNSPSFLERFIEALFYFGTYLDCLDDCMAEEGQDGRHRLAIEEVFRVGIRNMIGREGDERVARSVKVDVWRAFFRRFGMVEVGLSESSLYQASLVAKSKEEFRESCSLEVSGKGLLVGWKGIPLLSLTAWKFSR